MHTRGNIIVIFFLDDCSILVRLIPLWWAVDSTVLCTSFSSNTSGQQKVSTFNQSNHFHTLSVTLIFGVTFLFDFISNTYSFQFVPSLFVRPSLRIVSQSVNDVLNNQKCAVICCQADFPLAFHDAIVILLLWLLEGVNPLLTCFAIPFDDNVSALTCCYCGC